MWSSGIIICALALSSATAKIRGFNNKVVNNRDVDELLEAINEAIQIKGQNYYEVHDNVTLADGVLEGIRIGDLSTLRRKGNSYLTQSSLNNFVITATVEMAVMQLTIDSLTTGNYSGRVSIIILTNAVTYTATVTDLFQHSCAVGLDGLKKPNFSDLRIYTPDDVGAGFVLHKQFLEDLIMEHFIKDDMREKILTKCAEILKQFYCEKISMPEHLAELL